MTKFGGQSLLLQILGDLSPVLPPRDLRPCMDRVIKANDDGHDVGSTVSALSYDASQLPSFVLFQFYMK